MTQIQTWEESILRKTKQAKFVIATSLHGVILGDVLGIPTRLLHEHFSITGIDKYRDYFSVTGREFTYAQTLQQAVEMGPHPPMVYDTTQLWNSFPRDAIRSFDIYKKRMGG